LKLGQVLLDEIDRMQLVQLGEDSVRIAAFEESRLEKR